MKSYIIENEKSSGFASGISMRRWLAVIAIACLSFLTVQFAGIFLENFALKGTKDLVPIENFEYLSGSKKNDLTDLDSEWQTAQTASDISVDPDDKYTLFKMHVTPDSYYNAVCIKTDNAVIKVTANGQEILKQKNNRSYSDKRFEVVRLPSDGGEQIVEVTAYLPYTFRFNAFMTNYEKMSKSASLLGFSDVICGVALSVSAFILICFFMLLFSRGKIKFRQFYMPAILFLCGLSLILNPPFSFVFSSKLSGFKLCMTVNALIFVCALIRSILDKVEFDSFVESLGGLNLIYVLAIAMSPYDVLFSVLIKMFALMLAVDVSAYIYIMAKNRVFKFSLAKEAFFASYTFCAFMYWYSVSQRMSVDFRISMLFSAVTLAAVLMYFLFKNKKVSKSALFSKPAVSGNAVFIPQKLPADSISAIKKCVLPLAAKIRDMEIADENAPTVFTNTYGLKFEGEYADTLNFKLKNDLSHAQKVGEYSRIIAIAMGYSAKRAIVIGKAALLHDIGKLAVDYDTLTKDGILTEDEFANIRRHASYGYEMLSGTDDEFMSLAAIIAKDHHEHYDGTGYTGIAAEDIGIEARIVAIADVFDAISSKRSYKKSWAFEQVFDYILEHSGDFFDPKITAQFKASKSELAQCYYAYHGVTPEISEAEAM